MFNYPKTLGRDLTKKEISDLSKKVEQLKKEISAHHIACMSIGKICHEVMATYGEDNLEQLSSLTGLSKKVVRNKIWLYRGSLKK